MGFDDRQVRQLRAKLRSRHVRSRSENGVSWAYLEGWHLIAEANRIFGFDGWDRQTVECRCVYTKQIGARYEAVYTVRVRVTVRAGVGEVVREGSGAGEANAALPGQAHEFALKAAETDATKRALMTFGNPFGLSLYAAPKAAPATNTGNGATQDRTSQPRGANGRYTAANGASPSDTMDNGSGAYRAEGAESDTSDGSTDKGGRASRLDDADHVASNHIAANGSPPDGGAGRATDNEAGSTGELGSGATAQPGSEKTVAPEVGTATDTETRSTAEPGTGTTADPAEPSEADHPAAEDQPTDAPTAHDHHGNGSINGAASAGAESEGDQSPVARAKSTTAAKTAAETGGDQRAANGASPADKNNHGSAASRADAANGGTPDGGPVDSDKLASDNGEETEDATSNHPAKTATPISKARPIHAPIDKSALTLSEPKRIRDRAHLRFVASRPCLICGRNRAQAHHLTFAQPGALGRKVSDEFTVPLCSAHHQELHQRGDEPAFWAEHGIDPMPTAKALWDERRARDARTSTQTAKVSKVEQRSG